jgi:hypothetical protein
MAQLLKVFYWIFSSSRSSFYHLGPIASATAASDAKTCSKLSKGGDCSRNTKRSSQDRSCRETLWGIVESPLGRGVNRTCLVPDLFLDPHGLDPIGLTVHLPNCTPKQDRSVLARQNDL